MADIDPAGRRAVDVEIIADEVAAPEARADVDTLVEDGAPELPQRATRMADGSIRLAFRETVTLRYRTSADAPVKEEPYTELRFHRLKGEDMRAIQAASPESRSVVAIARSARVREGLMHRLFDRMDGEDVTAAGEVVAHFLGSGRRTTGR